MEFKEYISNYEAMCEFKTTLDEFSYDQLQDIIIKFMIEIKNTNKILEIFKETLSKNLEEHFKNIKVM